MLSPQKWISSTNAIGIISKSGIYGGTYAYKDIAFEFASWVSPEFKLYIIKDYQRLKVDENSKISLEWNANFIGQGLEQKQRLLELNKIARVQLKSLLSNKSVKKLRDLNKK